MKISKISVIMPVYNAERYLKEAIDSILNQSLKDFEFIIINDASTDKSKRIILSYKDSRIIYIENQSNLGPAKSRNVGLKAAKCEFIAIMDADDIAHSERLAIQLDFMKKSKAVISSSQFYAKYSDSPLLSSSKNGNTPSSIYIRLFFPMNTSVIAQPTVMFRRDVILNTFKGYDESRLTEDYDLWCRVSNKYPIFEIQQKLLTVRFNNKSFTQRGKDKLREDVLLVGKKHIYDVMGLSVEDEVMELLLGNINLDSKIGNIEEAMRMILQIKKRVAGNLPDYVEIKEVEKLLSVKYYSLLYKSIILRLMFFRKWRCSKSILNFYIKIKRLLDTNYQLFKNE